LLDSLLQEIKIIEGHYAEFSSPQPTVLQG